MRILDEIGYPVPLDIARLLRSRRLVCVEQPLAGGRIRGMIDLLAGIIAVDPGLSPKEKRLVICREVAHAVIPGHQRILLHQGSELDLDLGWRMRRLFRGQANRFAATLLFGGVPDAIIPAAEVCLDAVRILAALADVPLEAAFRRFVTRHPGRVWGLVCAPRSEVQNREASGADRAFAVRYVVASSPAIWCGTPRTVALPAAPTAVLAEAACPAGLERFRRAGARSAEWSEAEGEVLLLLK